MRVAPLRILQGADDHRIQQLHGDPRRRLDPLLRGIMHAADDEETDDEQEHQQHRSDQQVEANA